MKKHPARWSLVVLACLLATACQDRRDPVKPITDLSPVAAALA